MLFGTKILKNISLMLLAIASFHSYAQSNKIDGVAAVVGKNIVLDSDITVKAGNPVVFGGNADALPTGVDSGTTYYAIPVSLIIALFFFMLKLALWQKLIILITLVTR